MGNSQGETLGVFQRNLEKRIETIIERIRNVGFRVNYNPENMASFGRIIVVANDKFSDDSGRRIGSETGDLISQEILCIFSNYAEEAGVPHEEPAEGAMRLLWDSSTLFNIKDDQILNEIKKEKLEIIQCYEKFSNDLESEAFRGEMEGICEKHNIPAEEWKYKAPYKSMKKQSHHER